MSIKYFIAALMISGSLLVPDVMTVSADNVVPENPVEKIVEESDGNVIIDIPDDILKEILKEEQKTVQRSTKNNLRPGINKVDGYRIQIFSDGRHQSSLESRARARGNAVVAKFPKYRGQIYSFSSSPNWYTRVGNFRTSAEATSALTELKRAFPQFANEMRVVRSQIVVIK